MPAACSLFTASIQAGLPELITSDSRVWCTASPRSQIVVASEAAKLPAVIREKFDRPEACGVCWGGMPFSEMVTIEMKKVLIATPCTSIGMTSAQKLASGV